MGQGYLSIILHAHLPYVRPGRRHAGDAEFWFYERALECYLPLIRILDNLQPDRVRTRLTLSLSPTLIALMRDEIIQARLIGHVNRMLELSARELNRTALRPALRELAGTYHLRLLHLHNVLSERCGGDLLRAFGEMEARGQVELITGPASHAFLPGMLAMQTQAARCQVRLGMDAFESAFGHRPGGFWLPECAYTPELDDILGAEGVTYTVLDGRALERASTPAFHGIHAPVYCPSGVAAFGRDRDAAGLPGCNVYGHPADPLFRDNRRDIADDLPLEYLRPYLPDPTTRIPTGARYHRIGTAENGSDAYQRKAALNRAAEHAEAFLRDRMHRAQIVAGTMDRPPVFVCAYDMHVFGHRWFEGIEYLDYLLRKIHFDQDVLETVTPGEYLDRHRCNQMTTPAVSSWADKGYFERLVGPDTAWVYQHLSRAARVMRELTEAVAEQDPGGNGGGNGRDREPAGVSPEEPAEKEGNGNDLRTRALRAAARQLVLAQSSDWVTLLQNPQHAEYARTRLQLHLSNFARLASQIRAREIKSGYIEALERDWPIFGEIRTDAYR
jgi:1,4-alpha-glucan branching enzyme